MQTIVISALGDTDSQLTGPLHSFLPRYCQFTTQQSEGPYKNTILNLSGTL